MHGDVFLESVGRLKAVGVVIAAMAVSATALSQEHIEPVPDVVLEHGVVEPSPANLQAIDEALEVMIEVSERTSDEDLRHSMLYAAIVIGRSRQAGKIRCIPELVAGRKKKTKADGYTNAQFLVTYAGSTNPDAGRFTTDPDNQLEVRECLKVPGNAFAGLSLVTILAHEVVHHVQECDFPLDEVALTPSEKGLLDKKKGLFEVPAYTLQEHLVCDMRDGGYIMEVLTQKYPVDPFFDQQFVFLQLDTMKASATKSVADARAKACL